MSTITDPEYIDFPGTPTAVVRREALPVAEMVEFMDSTFRALGAAIGAGLVAPTGPAFSRYDTEFTDTVTIEAGFPIAEPLAGPIEAAEPGGPTVVGSSLPACELATAKHIGPYDGLPEAWAEFAGRIAASGRALGMPVWEAYDTEPTPDTDPATLVTGLAVPVIARAE